MKSTSFAAFAATILSVLTVQALGSAVNFAEVEKSEEPLSEISLDATARLGCPASYVEDPVVTVTASGTHVVSSSPAGGSTAVPCQIDFQRPTADICEVRLDFIYFNMTGPNDDGDCDRASLTVKAENLQDFITCGSNTGQHVYLEYGQCDIVSVHINPDLDSSTSPVFDIQATFISCSDSANLAPLGCDQYFTGATGQVRSFNYVSSASDVQYQINNQKYNVCIKQSASSKRIIWTPCPGEAGPFSISTYPSAGSRTGSACQTDWIDIPGSPQGRYCGGAFPSTVISSARPFQMWVNFDNEEIPGMNNMIDPLLGCPVGWNCVDALGQIIMPGVEPPGSVLPCGSYEGNALGQSCMLSPGLIQLSDSSNRGFCLQYVVQ